MNIDYCNRGCVFLVFRYVLVYFRVVVGYFRTVVCWVSFGIRGIVIVMLLRVFCFDFKRWVIIDFLGFFRNFFCFWVVVGRVGGGRRVRRGFGIMG